MCCIFEASVIDPYSDCFFYGSKEVGIVLFPRFDKEIDDQENVDSELRTLKTIQQLHGEIPEGITLLYFPENSRMQKAQDCTREHRFVSDSIPDRQFHRFH